MPLTKPLEEVRKDLNALLVEDIAAAIQALHGLLPEGSDKYSLVIALLGRLHDANKARLRNTLSNDDLQREYNRIRADFFDFVQDLQESDFEAGADPDAGGQQAPKQGSILYRIPNTMPVQKETKCVVRIALDEDALVENITIDEHVQLKELYRVSDTMQAELLDPSGGRVFRITTISEDIQIVDEHGYTEWWFYVTPLEEGSYPLILKIAIIEMVNGQPRSKELVLEETVQIIADGPVSDDEGAKALKPAGYALAFKAASAAGAGFVTQVSPPPQAAAAAPATAPTAAALGMLQKAVLLILALAGGSTLGWFATPEENRDWWKTRHLDDTAEGYAAFMNRYPDGKHYDAAACKKAALANTPGAYRDYLYEFPEGACREQAEQALERLERAMLEDLKKNPSETGLTEFYMQFPGCDNLGTLLHIVGKNQSLQNSFLPLIEQRWAECQLLFPDFGAMPTAEELPAALPDAPEQPDTPAPAAPTPPQSDTPVRPEAPAPNVPVPALALIRGGTFVMGSETGLEDEKPRRNVTVRDFYIGKTEVTFDEYDRFCGTTGRSLPKDAGWGRGNRPVIYVSWMDAVAYCNWLSAAHHLTPAYTTTSDGRIAFRRNANGYRLPTEAEWEYAARSGKNYTYSGSDNLNEVAWYMENSGSSTHPVAQKAPNALGLHDMSGNVREWCHDWYGAYPATDAVNPLGPPSANTRVLRGGQWGRNPEQLRITYRNTAKPVFSDYSTGFRLARWP